MKADQSSSPFGAWSELKKKTATTPSWGCGAAKGYDWNWGGKRPLSFRNGVCLSFLPPENSIWATWPIAQRINLGTPRHLRKY